MEKLFIQQRLTAEQLSKVISNYKKDPKGRKTSVYLRKLIEKVQTIYKTFMHTHNQITDLISEERDLDREYFSGGKLNAFEESHLQFIVELEEKLQEIEIEMVEDKPKCQGDLELKLPRIHLPKFSGKYDEWIPFRDLFTSLIHQRQSIANVEKLHYLKCSLSGEAEKLLKNVAITDVNYHMAWKTLNDRYDNKYILLNAHFKTLFGIGNATESSSSLKNLMDETRECVQSIRNLHTDDLWDATLVYITTRRLPSETRQLWEQQQQTNKNDAGSFENLINFLQNRFRALEAAGYDRFRSHPNISHPRNVHAVQSEFEQSCIFCGENHLLRKCQKFVNADYEDKFATVKRYRLCINCLGKGHVVAQCPSTSTCFKCKKTHHTLLHRDSYECGFLKNPARTPSCNATIPGDNTLELPAVHNVSVQPLSTNPKREVLLATALVTVNSSTGPVILRALLDQGSQTSIITQSAVQQLGLKRHATDISISGIGNSQDKLVKGVAQITILTRNKEHIHFEALILRKLTNLIPSRNVLSVDWERLNRNQLADPCFDKPGRIDLLLGAEVFARIILGEIHRFSQGPVAQNTKLGWIISGEVRCSHSNHYQSFKVEINDDTALNKQLQSFWELEEITTTKPWSEDEKLCENHFVKNVRRDQMGRFIVRLPFKSEEVKQSLGCSRATALASFLALEKRFQADPVLNQEYHECIHDYLKMGHMKPAPNTHDRLTINDETVCTALYLPHHAVYKDSSTTKCRIVFNASRKTSTGISLNDVLLTGPAIQNDILAVLSNWRLYKFAFIADIAKMYRQIAMDVDDSNYQRILWRNQFGNIEDYCLTTVTFGTTCAPFLAMRTLQKLAEEEKATYPNAYNAVMREFYVDDLLSGGHDLSSTKLKRDEVKDLLKAGGFPLRKWISNDLRILEDIPVADREMKPSHEIDLNEGYKSLGIIWHPTVDCFSYQIKLKDHDLPFTKRQLLSDIARLYDPLGWLTPVIIVAKTLMQSLWLQGLSWDEPVSKDTNQSWIEFRNGLKHCAELRIPRWIHFKPSSKLEIHGFCDASTKAYAATVYLVVRDTVETHAHLILSKSKVAPIRTISIPRLELCGAVLLSRLIKKVKEFLKDEKIDTWLWTDSEIVLSWLQTHPSKWKSFIANRTSEILSNVVNTLWRHVPSDQNPADLASRGLTAHDLINNTLWWRGPAWLVRNTDLWPKSKRVISTNMESKTNILVHLNTIKFPDLHEWSHKYSSLSRLVRVTAYCWRFIELTRKTVTYNGYITANEYKRAFEFWVKYTQQEGFGSDLQALNTGKPLDKGSNILKLNPFIDDKGMLRVGGRLSNSDLAYDAKYPIILPKNGFVVELLLQQIHKETMHGQTQLMLNTLRRKFWLLNGRNVVKHIIHKCIKCFRASAQGSTQRMGDLPAPRTAISRPFTHTGIDYCGPFDVRERKGRGSKIHKGYVAIFICLSVKAIHIELVSDLTTQAFLAALHRFVGRRGLCSHIYSDCGTNFVGAKAEFERIISIASSEAAENFAQRGVTWHFNPPASPHFGGLWEAGVKSIKTHLRRTIGSAALTFEELSTVLVRIEACLNSRPLCPLNDDPNDIQPLTPAHFLIGDSMLAPPEEDFTQINVHRLDRWQFVQNLIQQFWSRWKEEYLSRLQTRPKWLLRQNSIKVGDICIIKDDRSLPYQWPLAKIVQVHPGKDGLVRVVSVLFHGKTFKRSITKITVLPIQECESAPTRNKTN